MIKAPNWAKDAVPTKNGWVNSKGELLKSQSISDEQISEWYAAQSIQEQKPPVRQLHEAPVDKVDPLTAENVPDGFFNLFERN